jgi:3-deoxy-D-manno-octulosonic-acid transferase
MLKIVYSTIIFPSMFCFFAFIALFSRKVRKGYFPRFKTISNLKKWHRTHFPRDRVVLYHAASLGEFEHIKPIFQRLKERHHVTNIVTLFSPSGYEHAKNVKGVDKILYMPFDTRGNWKKIYNLLQPRMILISKHDAWPAQLWSAKEKNIPIFLINASLARESSRLRPGIRQFLKNIYQCFTGIYAISQVDAKRFSESFGLRHVVVAGDTKYDQVIFRKTTGKTISLIDSQWYQNKWIFLGGSVWPQDLENLIPACIDFLKLNDTIRIIFAPHQPEEKIITMISTVFRKWGVSRFSENSIPHDRRVLIIDEIGHLATLYKYANVAYVGGSFYQGIHNVMEAAIYGIPTLYGPVHKNSYEAVELRKNSGGIVINNSDMLFDLLKKLYNDDKERMKIGQKALEFVEKNAGASDRIVEDISAYLGEEQK